MNSSNFYVQWMWWSRKYVLCSLKAEPFISLSLYLRCVPVVGKTFADIIYYFLDCIVKFSYFMQIVYNIFHRYTEWIEKKWKMLRFFRLWCESCSYALDFTVGIIFTRFSHAFIHLRPSKTHTHTHTYCTKQIDSKQDAN